MAYTPGELEKWKSGDPGLLDGLPDYLREFMMLKSRTRPGRRFFGEAWVLGKLACKAERPWFNSFKWLTARRWIDGKLGEGQKVERLFYEDLVECLGRGRLKLAQERAMDYCRRNPDRAKPVPPDVVLLNKKPGKSSLIEVKLPGGSIHDGQLEGLSIIGSCLPVEVLVVHLYPEGK